MNEDFDSFEQFSLFDLNTKPEKRVDAVKKENEVFEGKEANVEIATEDVTKVESDEEILDQQLFPYEIEDYVKIVMPDEETAAPENYFYLKEFSKLRGQVIKVIENPSLQYEVKFKDKIAIIYHNELQIG